MFAQKQDATLTQDCQVKCQENQISVGGMFQVQFSIAFDGHELDHIESEIEKAGQEFKRQVTRHVLESADRRVAEVAQTANPCFHKHGVRPFTIVARYGEVQFDRQRLFDPKTRKTLIPSAIAWKTSKRRHLTAGLIDAACKESQQVSYRKASQNLADTSGQTSLIAASTVWNKKQQRGKELKSKQKQRVDKILMQHEAVLVEHKIVTQTTAPSPDEVELFCMTPEQEDEVDGHLWRGEHCLAIWKLWGLRSVAKNAKRIDDLIGYLLRKKRQLTNYEERHEHGEWIASTRVEKWNDVAVSQRCKHRGMSWTESGVLDVATYAENIKQNSHAKMTRHTIS
jgi:hypothetical protein